VEKPEVPDTADQVWLREHALAPWRYDVVLNPDPRRALGVRRDPSLDFDLDEITWIADDGIRYLNPEMALCYKARLDRRKDRPPRPPRGVRAGTARPRGLGSGAAPQRRHLLLRLSPGGSAARRGREHARDGAGPVPIRRTGRTPTAGSSPS
jgi:hypothetical protein